MRGDTSGRHCRAARTHCRRHLREYAPKQCHYHGPGRAPVSRSKRGTAGNARRGQRVIEKILPLPPPPMGRKIRHAHPSKKWHLDILSVTLSFLFHPFAVSPKSQSVGPNHHAVRAIPPRPHAGTTAQPPPMRSPPRPPQIVREVASVTTPQVNTSSSRWRGCRQVAGPRPFHALRCWYHE